MWWGRLFGTDAVNDDIRDSGVGGEASITGASSLPYTLANGNGNEHAGAEGDGHSDISGS